MKNKLIAELRLSWGLTCYWSKREIGVNNDERQFAVGLHVPGWGLPGLSVNDFISISLSNLRSFAHTLAGAAHLGTKCACPLRRATYSALMRITFLPCWIIDWSAIIMTHRSAIVGRSSPVLFAANCDSSARAISAASARQQAHARRSRASVIKIITRSTNTLQLTVDLSTGQWQGESWRLVVSDYTRRVRPGMWNAVRLHYCNPKWDVDHCLYGKCRYSYAWTLIKMLYSYTIWP